MSGEVYVVFGAGQVGKALAITLQQQGRRVRSVSRGGWQDVPSGIETVVGDVRDSAFALAAAADAHVLYMCLNLPYGEWEQHFLPLQMNLIEAAEKTGAKLVVLENMYMYGSTGGEPLRETTPLNATGRKGRVRAAMTQALFNAHHRGKIIATSARAADFFGPGVVYGPSADLFRNVLTGSSVQMPFSVDLPHTLTYVPTVVQALTILGASDAANGQPWHIPNAPTLTPRQVISRIETLAQQEASILVIPEAIMEQAAQADPMVSELMDIRHFYAEPYVVDSSRFAATFGDISVPWDEALATTVAWYRQTLIR